MNILIINGPNLNLLGKREPAVYGHRSFDDYLAELRDSFPSHTLEYTQTNVEGEIINCLHSSIDNRYDGIILNAGGYTHTSVAIRDAIAGIKTPVIEVHISNILNREDFRNKSLIGACCKGSISGFGLHSYHLAVQSIISSFVE